MKKTARLLLVCFLMALMPLNTARAAETTTLPIIERIAGNNRYETSIRISKTVYDHADTVVIASGENFPDGLAGGVLASVYRGPLLLSPKTGVPQNVKDEIKRLHPSKIFILGGTGSLGETVEKDLMSYGQVQRLAGKNREQTALMVAEEINRKFPNKHIGLAGANNFADSLAATALLARDRIPLLLTGRDEMAPEVLNYAKQNAKNIILFGGTGQIGNDLRQMLAKSFPITSFAGQDRYDTALKIATEGFSENKTVILAGGLSFPDALSAAPLAASLKAPILLSAVNEMGKAQLSLCARADKVIVVGGNAQISDALLKEIKAFRNGSVHEILAVNDIDEIVINYYGTRQRVKLIGTALPKPESDIQRAELTNKAYHYLDDFIGKSVTLQMDIRQRDDNNAILAYVYTDKDSRMLNAMLIEEGYLLFHSTPPNIKYDDYLSQKQEEAKKNKKGYWALVKTPTTPAEKPAEPSDQ